MIKFEGILTSKKNFVFKIKLGITKKFIYHETLDKLEDEASYLMGYEICFCAQKLHPRTIKILDAWRLDFLASNF